jgi:hypothetical protein
MAAVKRAVEGTAWSNRTAAAVPFLSFRGARLERCGILRVHPAVWVCWMCAGPIHVGPRCRGHRDTWTGVASFSDLVACVQHSVTGLVWPNNTVTAHQSHWMVEPYPFLLIQCFCTTAHIIIIIIIIFINCKWVDTQWQWSFHTLHMHRLWRFITVDLIGEGYMGSM